MNTDLPLVHQGTVLIVDDDPINRDLLEVMLAPDVKIVMASSGEQALALVAAKPPDLILLDIMMPGLDGHAVVRRLKDDPRSKHIPIIMVTAVDDRASRLRALESGAEELVTKPIDRAELRVRVRNLLRLKAYADQHDRYGQLLETEVGSRARELVESETRFRQLAESIDVVFFLTNPHSTEMLYVSPAYEIVFGRSCKELYAHPQSWKQAIHPADRQRVLSVMMVDGLLVPCDIEHRILRPDGVERLIRVRTFAIFDSTGSPHRLAGVVDDVTERKNLESQLRQANKMDAIGRLAAGVAHDFNNLLSIILSYSEFLSDDLAPDDPKRADALAIHGAGKRAVDLTRQLLAFSRQQVLRPEVSDLSEIIAGMKLMIRRLVGETIELVTVCPAMLGDVLIDHGQMEQVIMNLSVNARDAMPSGGRLLVETAAVTLDAAALADHAANKPGPYIRLTVTDTGSGMDQATQLRVFEPFFTTKGVGKGTGLGLATVFGIIQQSGGIIEIASEVDAGTTFRMHFPVARKTARIPVARPAIRAPSLTPCTETILLVDDDEPVRLIACTILRKQGYNVIEAQTGGDALLIWEQQSTSIDLLVTDVVMPRISGRQLAERLRATRPELKVLYMSGYTDDEVVRHGVYESTTAFMQKPITPEPFAAKVRETLDAPIRTED